MILSQVLVKTTSWLGLCHEDLDSTGLRWDGRNLDWAFLPWCLTAQRLQTSNFGITWELTRNADSQALPLALLSQNLHFNPTP